MFFLPRKIYVTSICGLINLSSLLLLVAWRCNEKCADLCVSSLEKWIKKMPLGKNLMWFQLIAPKSQTLNNVAKVERKESSLTLPRPSNVSKKRCESWAQRKPAYLAETLTASGRLNLNNPAQAFRRSVGDSVTDLYGVSKWRDYGDHQCASLSHSWFHNSIKEAES